MTPPEIRRRRRKTISTTNLQPRPRLAESTPIDESIFNTETELSQTRSSEVEPKPQPTDQQQTTLESTSDTEFESVKPSPARKMQIDEIHAELTDESNFNPDEPEYWDETHSWSHDLSESDDYWHFVGRYE